MYDLITQSFSVVILRKQKSQKHRAINTIHQLQLRLVKELSAKITLVINIYLFLISCIFTYVNLKVIFFVHFPHYVIPLLTYDFPFFFYL